MFNTTRPIILILVLLVIIGAIYFLGSGKMNQSLSTGPVTKLGSCAVPAKEFVSPSGFLNTPPFKLSDLIGKKIILVDFWTYSCINCQRTIPYLNDWYKKYHDAGLEIVGVHTPEFDFEKDKANVARAIEKFGIKYPVVQDNDYGTWNAYGNLYWPREYLIDKNGCIVHDQIGEGNYAETEAKIRELLGLTGSTNTLNMPAPATGITPELYLGTARSDNRLGSGQDQAELVGDWVFTSEAASNKQAGAKIVLRYNAQKVFVVAGSPSGEQIIVDVYQDSKLIKTITITNHDLYPLVENPKSAGHILELRIKNPNLQLFTFTFG